MLDHRTMHIDDIDTRVGAFFEVDGTEPRIAAREPLRIALRLLRNRSARDSAEPDSVYKASGRFARKSVA